MTTRGVLMKAVVLSSDDELELTDVPEPEPGPGEVKVRVTHAGIQWGDVVVRQGGFSVPRPFVVGFDAAGEIVGVGTGVDEGRIGEKVMALVTSGACAEFVAAPAACAFATPGIDAQTAAAFGWGAPTAYDLVHSVAHVRAGDTVLVHAAAGGVGSLAGQFARLAGARRLVGTVTTDALAEHALKLGYDKVLLAHEFPHALDEERFDVILDSIGGEVRRRNFDMLRPHGKLVIFGNIVSAEPVSFTTSELLVEGKSVLAYKGILLPHNQPERFGESVMSALRLLASGSIEVGVTAEFGLQDFDQAVVRLASGTAVGKAVVRVA